MNSKKISNEMELDIDLSNVKKIFGKYIYLILIITFISSLVGYFRARKLPKIWQGQFQIVLSSSNNGGSNNLETSLLSALGKTNPDNDLSTQLEIMNSPLVLIPTYENILKSKEFQKLNIKELGFGEIKSNLKSKFKDGTKVLNITFNNTSKELIPIVLKEISQTYQKFSYRDRQSNLEKGIKYLDNQKSIYSDKFEKSTKRLNEFSKKYDLTFSFKGEKLIINTEAQRIKAANLMREINQKINLLESTNNEEEFIYLAKIYNPESKILQEIEAIEQSLMVNSPLYKQNDVLINMLKKSKAILYRSLRSDLLAFLESEKKAREAEILSAERPSEVLSEYSRLIRENIRTITFLSKFEQSKNEISLELAKAKDPWEIITNPKVLDTPIGPDIRKIAFIYTFMGLFGISIAVIIYEMRKGLILTSSESEKILNIPKLLEFSSFENFENCKNSLKLLINSYLEIKKEEDLVLLYMGDKDNENIQEFSIILNETFQKKITLTNNPLEASKFKKHIIVVILGYNKKSELNDLVLNLKMQRIESSGFIAFDSINQKI